MVLRGCHLKEGIKKNRDASLFLVIDKTVCYSFSAARSCWT